MKNVIGVVFLIRKTIIECFEREENSVYYTLVTIFMERHTELSVGLQVKIMHISS